MGNPIFTYRVVPILDRTRGTRELLEEHRASRAELLELAGVALPRRRRLQAHWHCGRAVRYLRRHGLNFV